jgi:hypothetical protein
VINRRNSRIYLDNASFDYRQRPRVIDAATFILEQCAEKHKKRLNPFFDRVELCDHLGISRDCKIARIFKDTVFWPKDSGKRLIRTELGRNRYTLLCDIGSSKIEYEPR